MNHVRNVFVLAPVLAALVACTPSKDHQKSGFIGAAGIVADKNLSPAQKSERLARSAEQLLTLQGFAYADDVADLALEQDPSNLRAQFVKALMGPVMAQQGLLGRLKTLADQDDEAQVSYGKMMDSLEQETVNTTLKTFLLEGGSAIRDEADVQKYFDDVADGFKGLREFAKTHKSAELTIMASDAMLGGLQQRYEEACEVQPTESGDYQTNCPSLPGLLEVTLNRADFEAIQHIAAAYELYFSMFNSYDISGAIRVAQAHKGEEVSGDAILKDLLQNPRFGTLREGNGLQRVKGMGLDAIHGIRWIMANQNSLCANGYSHPRNRIGFLFNKGLCASRDNAAETARNLRTVESVLNGAVLRYDVSGAYSTSWKPSVLLETPIADVRSVLPTKVDPCGNAIEIADGTLGGSFPKGDFNHVLTLSSSCQ